MISWREEELLSLTDAAKQLPGRAGGKRPHVSTLYRWVLKGMRGVRLEALPMGGMLYTSVEALQRFFAALARARGALATTPSTNPRIEAVERELARHGI